ncbi:hypothetical protein HK405_012665, partial [Cladochytrium tenue]
MSNAAHLATSLLTVLGDPYRHHVSARQIRRGPNHAFAAICRRLELADAASDAASLDEDSTLAARAAVRRALRSSAALDGFDVERVLGFGAHGVVVAAEVTGHVGIHADGLHALRLGTKVAVKIVYKRRQGSNAAGGFHSADFSWVSPPADDASYGRGATEAYFLRFLARPELRHAGLIRFFGAWEDDHHYYLALELFGTDWLASVVRPDLPSTADDPIHFYNPRTGCPQSIPISPGSSDAWSWACAFDYFHSAKPAKDCDGDGNMDDTTVTAAAAALPNPDTVRAIFYQVLSAVHHLHTVCNLVHGDVKPENVLIRARRRTQVDAGGAHASELDVRLCDFSRAASVTTCPRADDQAAPPSHPLVRSYGSRQTTPPELRRADGGRSLVAGFPVECFALGILLFSLAHGAGSIPAIQKATAPIGPLPDAGPLPGLDGDLDSRLD